MMYLVLVLLSTLTDRPCFCTAELLAEHIGGPGVAVEAPFYCDFDFDGDVDLGDVQYVQNLWRDGCAMPE